MYFTDQGIEELAQRRASDEVSLAPEFEAAVDRLASWLARLDDDE